MKKNRYYIILLVFISTVLFGCVYKKHSKDNIRQEKIVLTMATDFYTFKDEIDSFNCNNDDYFIQVVMFDNEESFFQSIDSGEIPDFYSFMPSISGYKAIDPMKLSAKGMLTDLYQFIDQDEEISRETFIPGLLEVTELDSVLYQLPSSFYLMAVTGNANIIDENINSLEQIVSLMEKHNVEYPFGPNVSREWLASYVLGEYYYDFMNWENLSGNVDTKLFRDILKLLKLQPSIDEILLNGNVMEIPYQEVLDKKQCLLCPITVSSVNQIQTAYGMLGTNQISIIGYPIDHSICSIASNGCFGISSASMHQKVVWEFIRQFYVERETTALCTNLKALKFRVKNAVNMEDATQGTFFIGQGDDAYEVTIGPPTQNDQRIFIQLIENFDRMYRYEFEVINQIVMLASPYWNDTQDIDTTIQQIDGYLQEYFSSI